MRARATAVQHVFTVVLRVAEKRFLADVAITDNMVQLQRKEKGEKKGTSRAGKFGGQMGEEEEDEERLWGMLYADDAGIVSRSSEGLERMMMVIVTACARRSVLRSSRQNERFCPCEPKAGGRCRSQSIQPVR